MKKTTLILAACLMGVAALKAQIVVNQADFPVTGDKFVVVNDSNPAITSGASGAAVTWSYPTLGTSTVDTLKAILPSATLYGSFYPAANLALSYSLPGLEDAYLNLSAGGLSLDGIAETFYTYTVPVVYKPNPEKLYTFPMNYLSAWGSLTTFMIQEADTAAAFDSIRVKGFVHDTSFVESFGNCTTPLGTYATLRVEAITTTTDSVFGQTRIGHIWTPLTTLVNSDTAYTWIANGLGFPLLSMHIQGGKVHYASWLKSSPAGIDEITDHAGSLLYPNPANTMLNIKLVSCQTGTVSILDVTGRQISTTAFSNQLANVNTAALTGGMYFYRVSDKNGNVVDAGKFMIAK